ncbi:hypothetical protein EDC04DRAFT_1259621 [Pisolithus marmoratus]|nr:hypothetical protein EDC04DRAFT_1259621 [Pisolithus marmoratus]
MASYMSKSTTLIQRLVSRAIAKIKNVHGPVSYFTFLTTVRWLPSNSIFFFTELCIQFTSIGILSRLGCQTKRGVIWIDCWVMDSAAQHYDPTLVLSCSSNQSSCSRSLSYQRSVRSVNSAHYTTPPPARRRIRPLPPVPHLPHNSEARTEVWQSPTLSRQPRPLPVPPCYGHATSLLGPLASVPPLRRAVSLPQRTSTGHLMSEKRRKRLPRLVPDSPTMASMATRRRSSSSLSAIREPLVSVTQLSRQSSRVSSLSSVVLSTSEPPGTALDSPETAFSEGCPWREARIPNVGDLTHPCTIQTMYSSPPETVSPTTSQRSGVVSLSRTSHKRCTAAALATVAQTPCRSDCKRSSALTIHVPTSPLSSPSTETPSSESGWSSPSLTPTTPQSPSILQRRRFSKLRRYFGDSPPAAMVFGSKLGVRESSKPNMACIAPASLLPLTTKKWVWDKGGRRCTAGDYTDVIQYLRDL